MEVADSATSLEACGPTVTRKRPAQQRPKTRVQPLPKIKAKQKVSQTKPSTRPKTSAKKVPGTQTHVNGTTTTHGQQTKSHASGPSCPLPRKKVPTRPVATKSKIKGLLRRMIVFARGTTSSKPSTSKADKGKGKAKATIHDAEFIGFHGTNIKTAKLWAKQGWIMNPDSNAKKAGAKAGTSGADKELGEGLYISDALDEPHWYAKANGQMNGGSAVCAIFATSSTQWRNSINKLWLPDVWYSSLHTGNRPTNAAMEGKVREYSDRFDHLHASNTAHTVRFSLLNDRETPHRNQLAIPPAIARDFCAHCVPGSYDVTVQSFIGAPARVHTLNYRNMIEPWNIADASACAK
ncbi:hypothetical protein EXIGLDRAFT_836167 [Exidia glandulosa HHB12029]|uniref:Uncharacterized protein n=1 Tax=Exidia glandulosa HHB12029 TaxID=1314781 RepID=A0A165I2R5_EXIGL|nr:hypothetical protein EXIGLDRAFT_836167 [Exidia glandulosa HHB12029]